MVSPKEAAKLVLEQTGYEEVFVVKDYDFIHYVVEATPVKGKLPKCAQATFGVNKFTGRVTAFHLRPFGTLEKYQKAKICNL